MPRSSSVIIVSWNRRGEEALPAIPPTPTASPIGLPKSSEILLGGGANEDDPDPDPPTLPPPVLLKLINLLVLLLPLFWDPPPFIGPSPLPLPLISKEVKDGADAEDCKSEP
jgi:hypothetical protein